MDSNQPKGNPWPESMAPDYDNDTKPVNPVPHNNYRERPMPPRPDPEDTYRIEPGSRQVPPGVVIRGTSLNGNQKKKSVAIPVFFAIIFLLIVAIAAVIFLPGTNGNEAEQVAPATQRHINIPAGQADNMLSYGEWDGQFRYGQPDGNGTLKFSEQRLISQFDPKHTVARPGDYIIGEYDNGQLIHGRLYRTNGTTTDIFCNPPASTEPRR